MKMKSVAEWGVVILICIYSVLASAEDNATILKLLNSERNGAGIEATYKHNSALENAARRHCLYWSEHYDQLRQDLMAGKITEHDEVAIPGSRFYTPGSLKQRAERQQYRASVAENLQIGADSWQGAIRNLMSSMGHRVNFLDPELNDIGFYNCRYISAFPEEERMLYVFVMGNDFERVYHEQKSKRCENEASEFCPKGYRTCTLTLCDDRRGVMDSFVRSDAVKLVRHQKSGFLTYPYTGAIVEPMASNVAKYDEYTGYLRGQMISIELLPDTISHISSLSVQLTEAGTGKTVPVAKVGKNLPADRPGLNVWLPDFPLNWGGQYRIKMKYFHSGLGWQSDEIAFTVRKPEGNLIPVTDLQQTFSVRKGDVNLFAIDWRLTPSVPVDEIYGTYWPAGAEFETRVVGKNLIQVQSFGDMVELENPATGMSITINVHEEEIDPVQLLKSVGLWLWQLLTVLSGS